MNVFPVVSFLRLVFSVLINNEIDFVIGLRGSNDYYSEPVRKTYLLFQFCNGCIVFIALCKTFSGISETFSAVFVFAGMVTSNPTNAVPGFGAS